jgi:hypothetical protein
MTDPKFQHTPGQLARWEADRLKREALRKPAPIGWDASKAEAPWRSASPNKSVEDLYALVKSLGGFMCPPDRLEDHLVKGTVAATGRKPASDPPVASQGVNSGPLPWQRCGSSLTAPKPLDLSGVTLDADGWSSWIEAPAGGWPGGVCPISLVQGGAWGYRLRGGMERFPSEMSPLDKCWTFGGRADNGLGDLVATRIKARSASDTAGLPVGAVVRVWWGHMNHNGMPAHYSARLGNGWSLPTHLLTSSRLAELADEEVGWQTMPGAIYLPIDVRGA